MATYLYAVIFEHLISSVRWSLYVKIYMPCHSWIKKAHQVLKENTDLKEIWDIPLHDYSSRLVNCLNLHKDQLAEALWFESSTTGTAIWEKQSFNMKSTYKNRLLWLSDEIHVHLLKSHECCIPVILIPAIQIHCNDFRQSGEPEANIYGS